MIRSRLFLTAVLSLFAGAALFGAGGAGEGPDTGADEAKNRLVVYTYDAFPGALEDSIREALAGQGAGVEVVVERFMDTGGLFTQLLLEKDVSKADVVIGLDTTYLPRVFEEDLLQPYKPDGLVLAREELLVDPEYRAVAFDYGGIALNYDSEQLPDPPRNWDELTDPKYKNQIILINPATSSPGKSFLLFTIAEFGEDGYLDFWRALKPNILTVASGWSEGYGLYTQGEAPIVLSYETSPAYHKHYESVDRYRNLLFDDKSYGQVEVAGILRNAPHPDLAQKCIDHITSVEFQNLIPLNQFMYPVHAEAVLPEAFVWAEPAAEMVRLDAGVIAAEFDGWLERWEAVMR